MTMGGGGMGGAEEVKVRMMAWRGRWRGEERVLGRELDDSADAA